ncbi:MAG: permease, partial [Deltaproteobacteria bacterium]|nr:permease [Deltaproteobacteria bacterium]
VLGVVGSVGRKTSINTMLDLLKQGVSPSLGFVFLITSRNMTVHFWAIFALSLGAEFATGQVLGALVMIGIVALSLHWIKIKTVEAVPRNKSGRKRAMDLPEFGSWQAVLFSLNGWLAILKFIGQEIWRFAPSLGLGIVLGGIILAAGLRNWWVTVADLFGYATLPSDLTNAFFGAGLAMLTSLSPVGNLPLIHALFKTDGLGYPGIISFCLASAIHPRDIRTYIQLFGRRQGLILVGLLYGTAVLGGLGSTWIYAMFGFRPSLPPVRLIGKLLGGLLSSFGF